MKRTIFVLAMVSGLSAAQAQNTFHADLTSAQAPGVHGAAAFTLQELQVQFAISINLENVVPTTAQLVGTSSTFKFELGTPHVVIHSPGPWPNGYDGSTSFYGTFELPQAMLADFVAGRTTLELLGAEAGDFSGRVVPASLHFISGFGQSGTNMHITFKAEAPYQYFVERSAAVGMTRTVGITNLTALGQTFEAVVEEPAGAPASFYRVRRELCCQ